MALPYDKQFRLNALAIARKRDTPIAQLAKDFGIHETTICTWMKKDTNSHMPTGKSMNSCTKITTIRSRVTFVQRSYLLFASFIVMITMICWDGSHISRAQAQTPLQIVFPQSPANPMLITRPGYTAIKMFLPAHEQIISHNIVQGGAVIYRARNWCVLGDPVIPTLDFGCDMNSANNPLTEARPVWPPQVFTLDFVLPPHWFLSAVNSTTLANTGAAIPTNDQSADQIGIFAPGAPTAPILGLFPTKPAPVNIMVLQAYARCDFQAFYHMKLHGQQITIDQSQTTQNCHPRFPPLIQL